MPGNASGETAPTPPGIESTRVLEVMEVPTNSATTGRRVPSSSIAQLPAPAEWMSPVSTTTSEIVVVGDVAEQSFARGRVSVPLVDVEDQVPDHQRRHHRLLGQHLPDGRATRRARRTSHDLLLGAQHGAVLVVELGAVAGLHEGVLVGVARLIGAVLAPVEDEEVGERARIASGR